MQTGSTLIKWPGGKTGELAQIVPLIPPFRRYLEPFFGGGALFFHLQPQRALINDLSKPLTDFYALVKAQDEALARYLYAYAELLGGLLAACDARREALLGLYRQFACGKENPAALAATVEGILGELPQDALDALLPNKEAFETRLFLSALDKLHKTVKNAQTLPFREADLLENLIAGVIGGAYLYFREVHNDLLLRRGPARGKAYHAANFFFIREFCYGSMFRYNRAGEFNIPYGGMSYNRKDFRAKVDRIFSPETARLFQNTEIFCMDFEAFLQTAAPNEEDFLFLDPPYDSDFSDYEGKVFTLEDQRRLAEALKRTRAKFLLVIKNTEFIRALYEPHFRILSFDKRYAYNVRSRNNRSAQHLIITNLRPPGASHD